MRWFVSLAAALALLIAASPVGSQVPRDRGDPFDRCEDVIDRVIDRLGVQPGEIEYVQVVERFGGYFGGGGDEDPRVIGWTGWMRPVEVKGYLVVEVSLHCAIRQVYTRGDYRLDGVSHY